MIRAYKDTDWSQVSVIYDMAKPDEMKGIVDANAITPLAQDGQMLRYFFDSEVLVYEENERILGFIGRKKNVISWLFVHPEHRRKGIARSLLKELMETYQGPLKLNVAKNNKPAMTLYESLGFEVFEEFEGDMYGNVIPAVRMRLHRDTKAEQSHPADADKPRR